MALRLKVILEKIILVQMHPRSLIAITVQPIALDGPVFAHMLNACVAALIDAAVPLRTTIVAVGGVMTAGTAILLDATKEEADVAIASFDLVFDIQNGTGKPMATEYVGAVGPELRQKLEPVAFGAAKQIGLVVRRAAKERLDLFLR